MMSSLAKCRLPAVLILVGSLGVACDGGDQTRQRVLEYSASEQFPYNTLEDWVSYADKVVVFAIESEAEHMPDEERIRRGQYSIGRSVRARIDEVLWTTESTSRSVLPLARGDAIEFFTDGWWVTDGTRIPTREEGGDRLDVGETYLTPVVRFPDGQWGPMGAASVVKVNDGIIATIDSADLRHLDGMIVRDLTENIEGEDVDPRAAGLMDLPPGERVMAVYENERSGS